MDDIKAKIGKGGLALVLLGLASSILSFFNYNIKLLAWIDIWGDTMGWVIRILLIAVGGLLFFFLGRTEEEEINQQNK